MLLLPEQDSTAGRRCPSEVTACSRTRWGGQLGTGHLTDSGVTSGSPLVCGTRSAGCRYLNANARGSLKPLPVNLHKRNTSHPPRRRQRRRAARGPPVQTTQGRPPALVPVVTARGFPVKARPQPMAPGSARGAEAGPAASEDLPNVQCQPALPRAAPAWALGAPSSLERAGGLGSGALQSPLRLPGIDLQPLPSALGSGLWVPCSSP